MLIGRNMYFVLVCLFSCIFIATSGMMIDEEKKLERDVLPELVGRQATGMFLKLRELPGQGVCPMLSGVRMKIKPQGSQLDTHNVHIAAGGLDQRAFTLTEVADETGISYTVNNVQQRNIGGTSIIPFQNGDSVKVDYVWTNVDDTLWGEYLNNDTKRNLLALTPVHAVILYTEGRQKNMILTASDGYNRRQPMHDWLEGLRQGLNRWMQAAQSQSSSSQPSHSNGQVPPTAR